MDTIKDKISAFVKGPGWFPGTPRLGDINMVPEIQHREKYNPQVSTWVKIYVAAHMVFIYLSWLTLNDNNMVCSVDECIPKHI